MEWSIKDLAKLAQKIRNKDKTAIDVKKQNPDIYAMAEQVAKRQEKNR